MSGCLGYVRVSTQRQAEGGISLDNQETKLAAHYRQRGTDYVETYRGGRFSGTTTIGVAFRRCSSM